VRTARCRGWRPSFRPQMHSGDHAQGASGSAVPPGWSPPVAASAMRIWVAARVAAAPARAPPLRPCAGAFRRCDPSAEAF